MGQILDIYEQVDCKRRIRRYYRDKHGELKHSGKCKIDGNYCSELDQYGLVCYGRKEV